MKTRFWYLMLGMSLFFFLVPLSVFSEESNPLGKSQYHSEQVSKEKADLLNEQAVKLYRQGKYNEAEPLFVKALSMRKQLYSEAHPDIASSLDNLAHLYYAQAKYKKVELLLNEALSMRKQLFSDEHPKVLSSMNNLATLYLSQGKYEKAEPLYSKVLAKRRQLYSGDLVELAFSISNLAELYQAQSKQKEAEPLLLEALTIRKKLYSNDQIDLARSYLNLALSFASQGRYAEAEPLLVEALAMSRRLFPGNHPSVADNLRNLAVLYKDQGRYAEAETFLVEAVDMYKSLFQNNHSSVSLSLDSLASVYVEQGRYTEAESLYKEALAIDKQLFAGDHPAIAGDIANIASVYVEQGRYAEAESLYTEALAMNKRLFTGDSSSISTNLNNIANVYVEQGRYAEAESFYTEALAMNKRLFTGDHPSVSLNFNNLAVLYRKQEKYNDAEPLFKDALAMRKRLFSQNHLSVVNSLSSMSILYQAQKLYPQAIDYLIQVTKAEEAIITENLLIGSEQQKKQFLNLFQNSTNRAISFHLQAIPDNKESAELALTTILRRKGRVLDATGQALQTLRDNLDLESEQLFVQLASTQTQLANLSSRPLSDDATQRKNIQTQQQELDQEIKQLEAQLSSRSAEFKRETTPVTIEQVQQAIPNNAALVEFIQYKPFDAVESQFGEPRYAIYVLLPDGQMKWQDLGEASVIDDKIQRFRTLLGNGGERGLGAVQAESGIDAAKQVARELDTLLMKPVRGMVGDATHLLLSPDSQLNTLPFAALVDEQDKYLVENYLITYLTSGRDLLRLQLNQNQETSEPLLLANPTYSSQGVAVASADIKADKENDTRARRSGELGKLEFASLPGTKVEGEAIKELVPNIKVYTEQEASENNLKQTQNPEFLHLATHGFFLPPQEEELNNDRNGTLSSNSQIPVFSTAENPLLRSGLALAGFNQRDSGDEDGVLTALEVTGLNLRGTKLVVMSACETGLGDVQAGEGVYGLRRAFTLAGAQSQLMSLWSVSDEGTKDLMVNYYTKIQNGEGRGEALRQVQLEMLNSEDRNHPFYWAAFIPSGSWKPLDSSN